jgi:hypothetical protein
VACVPVMKRFSRCRHMKRTVSIIGTS